MGPVVLLSRYSDFPYDHIDFSVYFSARKKIAEAQKSTINTVKGLHRGKKPEEKNSSCVRDRNRRTRCEYVKMG